MIMTQKTKDPLNIQKLQELICLNIKIFFYNFCGLLGPPPWYSSDMPKTPFFEFLGFRFFSKITKFGAKCGKVGAPAQTMIVTEFGNIEEPTPKSIEKLMFDYKKCILKISEKRLNDINIILKLFGTFYIKNIESTLDRCHRSPHGG